MEGGRIFNCFSKTYKVTARKKLSISGRFADLDVGNSITIQIWPADSHVGISYADNKGQKHEFEGYQGQITRSLENFDLEEE